jgi:prepilin-type N-terminal cleavage/methylation domain-containing protein
MYRRRIDDRHSASAQAGFTLIELVLVVLIVGLAVGLLSVRMGAVDFWKEQSSIRKLTETIMLLNNQAVMDQAFYRMEFDLENNQYRVGVLRPEDALTSSASSINLPPLVLELSTLISPSIADGSTMIPPPSIPSLAEPTKLGGRLVILDVVTPRGKITRDDDRDNPFLLFSPRGFSEFGVIHLSLGGNAAMTIMANPWTGMADVYREYKEFQWTLGQQSTN